MKYFMILDWIKIIMYENKKEKLRKVLKDAKYKECLLFLALEHGSGMYEGSMQVVVNPRVQP